MKLSELASKPQLIKLTLDDEYVINTYGDSQEFYIWDRLSIEDYTRLARINNNDDPSEMLGIIKDYILDENADPVMRDGRVLPPDLTALAVREVVEYMGKSLKLT